MDKNTVVKLGLIGVGGLVAWYIFTMPSQTKEAEADFYGGTPSNAQLGQLEDAGFFDPDPSDYANKFNVPYFGNSPYNQTTPNPLNPVIDAISNATNGSIGCCAQSQAPAIFVAPSMEYTPVPSYTPPPVVVLPEPAPAAIPVVAPKRTLADMVRESDADVRRRYASWGL